MRRSLLLIANPASGRTRGARMAAALLDLLRVRGADAVLVETTRSGHAREFAARLAGAAEAVLAIGGDGTLNEVVNGMLDAGVSVPILPVPAGTANVVAAELGLPAAPAELAEVALSGAVRIWDAARAGNRAFLMTCGAGFDAAVVEAVHAARAGRSLGLLSYFAPALRIAFGYSFPRMDVSIDGEPAGSPATFVLVGNTRLYGGPFSFFPDARPDDGLLDVCCMRGAAWPDLFRHAWGAFRRALAACPDVSFHRGTRVRIEAAGRVPVQIDGDPGGELPVEIGVLPGAVRLLA